MNTATNNAAHRRGRRSAGLRRGLSVTAIMMLACMIGLLLISVNWAYLVMLQRHNQRLSDQLALVAVSQLLDESILEDAPFVSAQDNQGTSGTDDVGAAEQAVLDFLNKNNLVAPQAAQIDPSEVTILPAHLSDAASPASGGNVDFNPTTTLYNTLTVEIYRDPNGSRRVLPLINGLIPLAGVAMRGTSFATLDSRAIGFRPTTSADAPLSPLAVQRAAWEDRANGTLDENNNNRLELWIELRANPLDEANGALISFDASSSFNANLVPEQIERGLTLADAASFGPATTDVPYGTDSTDLTPANLNAIRAAYANVIGTKHAVRAFPLYETFTSPLELIGFVGAEILEVDLSSPRLRVRVEPAFVVNPTLQTQFSVSDGGNNFAVPENLYLAKIRLTR